jgi:hypothetical protein
MLGSVVSYSVDIVTLEKSEDVSRVLEELSEEEEEDAENDNDSNKAEADDKSE